MKKIDFSKIKVEVNFDGETRELDVKKDLANYVKLKTVDIGLEDFCREIYHSKEGIEVPDEYKEQIIGIISAKDCPLFAFVKRGIINALNSEEGE